jgi:hypothetical protein
MGGWGDGGRWGDGEMGKKIIKSFVVGASCSLAVSLNRKNT